MSKQYIKTVARRLLKGFLSGFSTGIILISITDVHTWGQFATSLNAVALAGTIGGLNGVILAIQKAISYIPEDTA